MENKKTFKILSFNPIGFIKNNPTDICYICQKNINSKCPKCETTIDFCNVTTKNELKYHLHCA